MELNVSNLHFAYGARPILDGVNFTVKSGDRVALLGPNGTGKTTLFRCLMQFLRYSGSVTVDGADLKTMSPKEISRHISYIPQSEAPTFNYPVRDVVLMGVTGQLGAFSAPKKEHREKVLLTLEHLGIAHLADRGYATLSGGERQLVMLSRAMVQEAKLLIMDEPTANLDFATRCRVMDAVVQMSKEGYAILYSTHHPGQSGLYASRVLALLEGKVFIDGTADDLTETALSRLYGMDVALRSVNFEGKTITVCLPGGGA